MESTWTRNKLPLLTGASLAVAYMAFKWLEATKVRVVVNADSKYASLIKQCKSAESYWPSILGINSFLELLPFMWIGSIKANRLDCAAEDVEMSDGEVVQVVWYQCKSTPSFDQDSEVPIVMLHHGLLCRSADLPGQGYIQQGLSKGWMVCALNRRGHVPHRPLTKPTFHIFGSTNDVRQVVEHIRTKRPNAPVYMIGLSSGSGLVAKLIGEQGQTLMEQTHPSFVNGVVGVTPGYNIERCMARIRSPYNEILLESAKKFFLGRNEALLSSLPGYTSMSEAKNLQSFLDESFTFAGYASKDEFYRQTNPMATIQYVRDPTLIINAENDPICVLENVLENMHLFEVNEGATLLLSKMGSHLPFYEFSFNPLRFDSWAERVAYEYIEAVEGHRRQEAASRRLGGRDSDGLSVPSPSRPVSASATNSSTNSPSDSPSPSAIIFGSPVSSAGGDPISPWSTVKSPQPRDR